MSTPSLLNIPYLYKAGTLYSQIPESGAGDFTVTRATTPTAGRSTRINKDGLIELVADNVPRLDYPLGGAVNGCPALLVEPSATNSIRNNSMVGAVAGTPGTLPTGGGWTTSLIGLTQTIVGFGTENGISYIDIRFSGTATSTNSAELRYESTTQIVASSGQTWSHSVYLKKIAEPSPPNNYQLNIYERDSVGGYVANGASTIAPTTTIQRFTQTRTLSGALTARVQPGLFFGLTNLQFYDFTIRIGYPQMELGSVATSVIPTTTGSVTRNADVISVSGAVSGSIGQTEGTLYAEVDVRLLGAAGRTIIECNNRGGQASGSIDARVSLQFSSASGNTLTALVVSGGTTVLTLANTLTSAGIVKIAFGYKTGDSALYVNGVSGGVSTSAFTFPATMNEANLGQARSAISGLGINVLNDRIRAAAIYPNRLTNAQLATLTAP